MKITDSKQCDCWYQALLDRSSEYTGVFFVVVKTTGVFCISVCRARKPKHENVEFCDDVHSVPDAGFRPCQICRPTENTPAAPCFIEQATELIRKTAKTRITDTGSGKYDSSPERVRCWFLQNQGMTFQAFQRMQRMNAAFRRLKSGRTITDVASDSGYLAIPGKGSRVWYPWRSATSY